MKKRLNKNKILFYCISIVFCVFIFTVKINSTLASYGYSWAATSSVQGGWQDVAVSNTGQYQLAVYGGAGGSGAYNSSNYGSTWTVINLGLLSIDVGGNMSGAAISGTGQYQSVTAGYHIYKSNNYGATWTSSGIANGWTSIGMSNTGQYQTALAIFGFGDGNYDNLDNIYVSTDYGVSWNPKGIPLSYREIKVSGTGQYQTAIELNGNIYTSSDYGNTWTARDSKRNWQGIAISYSGQYQVAGAYGGNLYVSQNYGVSWTAKDSIRNWKGTAVSNSGQYQTAVEYGGSIYTSSNYGATWTISGSGSHNNWYDVAMSSGGDFQLASAWSDSLYSSASGTINVSSNISSASWTITGPTTLTDSGMSKSYTSEPTGTYIITYNPVAGYNTPDPQSFSLSNAGTISFSGTYVANCGTAQDSIYPTIIYGTVIAKDGNCWLDRNLGATEVATSSTDYLAYGSLFQWGRLADGHQLINCTNSTTGTAVNGTTTTLATTYIPGNSLFIKSSAADWLNPQNNILWQGVSGINNPCPVGFRFPTEGVGGEWYALRQAEGITNAATAYSSTLKLPAAGERRDSDGTLIFQGSNGYYWGIANGTLAENISFSSSTGGTGVSTRAYGYSVRCIKDNAPITLTINAGDGTEVKSSDNNIDCKNGIAIIPGACSYNYANGTNVSLTETTNAAYNFVGWSGDCSGTGGTCAITMNAAKTVTTNASLACYCTASAVRCPSDINNSCGNPVCSAGTRTDCGGGFKAGTWQEVAP